MTDRTTSIGSRRGGERGSLTPGATPSPEGPGSAARWSAVFACRLAAGCEIGSVPRNRSPVLKLH